MRLTCKSGKAGKVHISIDGEYAMTVDSAYWISLGIADNSEISADALEQLRGSIAVRRAFNKGVSLLSMREHSRTELIRKLSEKGMREAAVQAADELEACGYLDDRRFAEALASDYQRLKKMGKRRIRQELYARGVKAEVINEVLDSLEEDSQQQINQLLDGKLNRFLGDEKGRLKCFNTLVRMGYSPSDIRCALDEYDITDAENAWDE